MLNVPLRRLMRRQPRAIVHRSKTAAARSRRRPFKMAAAGLRLLPPFKTAAAGSRRPQPFKTAAARSGRRRRFKTAAARSGQRRRFKTVAARSGPRRHFKTVAARSGRRPRYKMVAARSGQRRRFKTAAAKSGGHRHFKTAAARSGRRRPFRMAAASWLQGRSRPSALCRRLARPGQAIPVGGRRLDGHKTFLMSNESGIRSRNTATLCGREAVFGAHGERDVSIGTVGQSTNAFGIAG